MAATALLLGACAGDPRAARGDGNAGPSAPSPVVKLAGRAWDAAAIDNALAKALLEDELHVAVEIVPTSTEDVVAPLARGEAHVDLEVWADATMMEAFAAGRVVALGPLGPVGKIGWYVPTYVVDEVPAVKTWHGLRDPSVAARFATAATGERGRFLAGDPAWGRYDEQIVRNLRLPLEVVYAGSEEALLDEVDRAYQKRVPILFYMWLPHWAFAVYDLTEITLPPYSDECYARFEEGGLDCDYPTTRLLKVAWPGLAAHAPAAYALLRQLTLTTQDQIALLERVRRRGETPEAAARHWIATHEATWRAWVAAAQ